MVRKASLGTNEWVRTAGKGRPSLPTDPDGGEDSAMECEWGGGVLSVTVHGWRKAFDPSTMESWTEYVLKVRGSLTAR
jgi:hypothetical protein